VVTRPPRSAIPFRDHARAIGLLLDFLDAKLIGPPFQEVVELDFGGSDAFAFRNCLSALQMADAVHTTVGLAACSLSFILSGSATEVPSKLTEQSRIEHARYRINDIAPTYLQVGARRRYRAIGFGQALGACLIRRGRSGDGASLRALSIGPLIARFAARSLQNANHTRFGYFSTRGDNSFGAAETEREILKIARRRHQDCIGRSVISDCDGNLLRQAAFSEMHRTIAPRSPPDTPYRRRDVVHDVLGKHGQ
jgi:hypothetical protein